MCATASNKDGSAAEIGRSFKPWDVAPFWQFDNEHIGAAFGCIIFFKLDSKPRSFSAHDGINSRIERGAFAQRFCGKSIFLQTVDLSVKSLLNQERQQPAGPFSALKQRTRQNLTELYANGVLGNGPRLLVLHLHRRHPLRISSP